MALIDGPPRPKRRWAFVLVDVGQGVDLTREQAFDKLFSTQRRSVHTYYDEVSYGTQVVEGDVFGPLHVTPTAWLCDNYPQIVQQLQTLVPKDYDQYLWYVGSRIQNCEWRGLSQMGRAAAPLPHSFYNGESQCQVLIQEPGHNFGMVHSSAMRCREAGLPVSMTTDPAGCEHDEYGNPFDPMGGGAPDDPARQLDTCLHMNGVQKAYQAWLGSCNIVKATTGGLFTIHPLAKACRGLQVLQVPLVEPRVYQFPPSPNSRHRNGIVSSYYVEYRTPTGLDAPIGEPRLFLIAAHDVRPIQEQGNPNWLIDTTPETASMRDAGLAVGKTFRDPAPGGPQITLVSADATAAVVRVQLGPDQPPDTPGGGLCSDGVMFTAPGPDQCVVAPEFPTTPPLPDGGSDTQAHVDAIESTDAIGPVGIDSEPTPTADGGPTATPPAADTRRPGMGGHALPAGSGGGGCHIGQGPGGTPLGVPALVAVALGALVSGSRRRR